MNRFFRFVLVLFVMAAMTDVARAMEIVRIYQSRCETRTGVILDSSKRDITLLLKSGQVMNVPKHDIIGLARYSVANFSPDGINSGRPRGLVPAYRFVTRTGFGEFQTLIGWPNGYTNEYVQIFGTDLQEYQVLRATIWDVDDVPEPSLSNRNQQPSPLSELSDPLEFSHCGHSTPNSLPPFASYGREIELKSYFDSILAGQEQIDEYRDERLFYPVPQVYENYTRLGTWLLIESRYANAGARKVNFLPYIIDSLSEGPFSYQRTISSGVSPVEWISHTEPILHALFALKVSYIHFRFFIDPSVILLGDRYRWTSSQLDAFDERPTPAGGGRFGVDLGHWSAFFITTQGHLGAQTNDYFVNLTYSQAGAGLMYQTSTLLAEVIFSNASLEDRQKIGTDKTPANFDAELNVSRLNLALKWTNALHFKFSWARRKVTLHADATETGATLWEYDSVADDYATQVDWNYDYRWRLYTRLMLESIHREANFPTGESPSQDFLYGKGAIGVSVAF